MTAKIFRRLVPILLLMIPLISTYGQVSVSNDGMNINKDLSTVNTLCQLGNFDRALEILDKIKEAYPDYPKLIYMYKRVYLEAKRYQDLENMIMGQLELDPSDNLLLTELGNAKYLLDEIKAADSLWNLALDSAGDNASVYLYVAGYKLQYGDYDGAADAYLKGRAALGSPALFSNELAGVYESQRKYGNSVGELLLSLAQTPSRFNIISSKIGGYLKDSENTDEILDAVIEGASEYTEKKEFLELLGEVYIKLNRMDKAFETFGKLGKGQKDDGASFCVFAERCYDNQAYATAIEAADKYLNTNKLGIFKEKALYVKGKSQRKTGDIEGAISTLSSLRDFTRNKKFSDDASFLIGSIYADDKGDCVGAVREWRKLAPSGNAPPQIEIDAAVEMANCYIRMDSLQKADIILSGLQVGKKDYRSSSKAKFLQGDLAFIRGDYSDAKNIYENLAGINPTSEYANNALERLTVMSASDFDGKTGDGLDMFAQGIRAMDMGRLSEAAEIFSDSAFAETSLNKTAIFYSAITYSHAGNPVQAAELFNKYIELFPDGSYADRACLGLGDIYMMSDDTYPLAKKAFSKILKDYSGGPAVEQARERLRRLEATEKIG